MRSQGRCGPDGVSVQCMDALQLLPQRLREKLMPFQREELIFALSRDRRSISTIKVTILGYGPLTMDTRPLLEALNKQRFTVVLVDESHYLKSRNSARSKILVPIIQSAKRAILLTGTPALGRPEELFMQIDAFYPRRFGTWSDKAKNTAMHTT
ncbi:DNA annealing helicase and endonuclease ZRANB3-like, partial [Carassius auratus]|uniref:DNA annealing helicase and endonuclease ZRANB3-like n=1 Tax=Carassius auratus TaxID=7957 RepID=A0A6P6N0V9_CARAU